MSSQQIQTPKLISQSQTPTLMSQTETLMSQTETLMSPTPTQLSFIKTRRFGIFIACIVLIIIAIVVYLVIFKKPYVPPSAPIIFNGNHPIKSILELYPETDYKKGAESAAYPSYIEINNIIESTKYDNILVKSLKVKNCKVTLFSENNYTGKTMIIDDKYNINNTPHSEPLLEGFKSVKIERYFTEYELFNGYDFKNDRSNINLTTRNRTKDEFNTEKIAMKAIQQKGYFNISNEIKLDNTIISSVRSYGLILTLYTNPDFTGKETVLSDNIINIPRLPESAQSIKIIPILYQS
jgi:hypothetical protein